jgi:hypothetical protein
MLRERGQHVHHQLIGMWIVRRDEIDPAFHQAATTVDRGAFKEWVV